MPQEDTSILSGVKKMLGIPESDTSFDVDITAQVNSTLMTLNQIGIGESGYQITDKEDLWGDFITTNLDKFGGLETYMYFKVRLGFDPPSTSFAIDAMTKSVEEMEYRFKIQQELLNVEEVI